MVDNTVERSAMVVDALARPRASNGRLRYLTKMWRNKPAFLSMVVLAVVGLLSVVAPVLPIPGPNTRDLRVRLLPPSMEHPFGTDHQGRDVLSRTLHGGRISITVSLVAVLLAAVVGGVLGLLSGFFTSVDNLIMRLTDVQLSFPSIMLAIAIVAAIGPSIVNLVIVLAVSGWVDYARVVRAEVLSLRERDFSEAARALGCSEARIAFRHVLPNVTTSIVILATLQAARFMLQEAGLSFLGLGVPPDVASWGGMLSEAQQQIFIAWWPALFPGLAISVIVLSINIFGDWLGEALDSRAN